MHSQNGTAGSVALVAGLVVAGFIATGLAVTPARAQDTIPPPDTLPPAAEARTDSLQAALAALRVQLDSLRARLTALEAGGRRAEQDSAAEDPLAAIRAAAVAAADAASTDTVEAVPQGEREFVGRQRNLSVFNPEISVTGDVLALVDSEEASDGSVVAREFEVSFQSNLDPYSRAKIFLAHHEPGAEILPFALGAGEEHEEASTEIEEGYIEWVGLPGGLRLKAGKFRQRFGTLNRWHTHALPGQMLPLPYLAFFGEHGLTQIGASLHWLVPVHGLGAYEVWGELTRSGNETLFGESHGLSGLAHVNGFWELSPASYFELGLSGLVGPQDAGPTDERFGSRVYGIDFSFNWRPPQQALYRELTLRGGGLMQRCDPAVCSASGAWGAFVIGEYRLGRRWLVGARYEYTQDPSDPDRDAWLAAPTLTWWQSEFVRIRGEYDILGRPGETFHQFSIQLTFAMGPHRHEAY